MEENRRILKKAGCRVKNLSFFRLHTLVMENLHRENRISIKVDSFLRHKYRKTISEFGLLGEDEFMKVWRTRLKRGEIDDIFYLASVKPDLSDQAFIEIYGEVHMLGHANMGEIMQARKALSQHTEANRRLTNRMAEEKTRSGGLKKEFLAVKNQLKETQARLKYAEKPRTPVRPETSADMIELGFLQRRVAELETQNRKLAGEAAQTEREKRKLQIRLFELQSVNQRLGDEVSELLSSFSQCSARKCNESCPEYPVCAKRILVVGGITRIRHLYRDLVESFGGTFDYHDGYMKNGKQNIEAQVRRSDLVICPVNCNSHGACDKIKHLCRKHGKTVRMLPGSSLSAISSALCSENFNKN
ncbi:DUF2325 domain-containing protein [Desulfonema ishimotonii]|uniref:DUF2325 domain-containing protein n=2 Tax=Desulfonema ishimotonii TaxID=45657 RepID=A0A401FY40_9BACT|nr:DUF2325 domain-containing protein [Desulfonema ishimotonii]